MRIRKRQSGPGAAGHVDDPPAPLPITCTYQKSGTKHWHMESSSCGSPGLMRVTSLTSAAVAPVAMMQQRPPYHHEAHGHGHVCKGDMGSGEEQEQEQEQEQGQEEEDDADELEKLELGRHSNGYMGSHHHHHGDEPGPPQLIGSGRHSHGVLLKSISPKIRKVKSETYSRILNKTPAKPRAPSKYETGTVHKRSRDHHPATGDRTPLVTSIHVGSNSKEALISSIFYVFDTLGKNGFTASEVVHIMLEQGFPGLKEGGARHTVQVANVLRCSPYFISIGNKRYLPCTSLEERDHRVDLAKSNSCDQFQKQQQQHGDDAMDIDGAAQDDMSRLPMHHHHQHQHQHQQQHRLSAGGMDMSTVPQSVHIDQETVKKRRGRTVASQEVKGNTHCKVYDGSGWKCNRHSQTGYSICKYHLDLVQKPSSATHHVKATAAAAAAAISSDQNSDDDSLYSQQAKSEDSDTEVEDVITRRPYAKSRERTPGVPMQKRKMLSLLSIK